jgi:DNA-binding MarR family transcriptional regulator
MIQAQRAQNPLFLRDAELERSLALLTLLQLELEAVIAPVLARLVLEPADALLLDRVAQVAGRGQPVSAAELVVYLGWTKQRMSRRLASLIARGLIERQPAPSDRRRQLILPTGRGQQQLDELQALQKRHLRRIFRRAGPAEVAGFQNVLVVAAQHAARGRQAALAGAGPADPAETAAVAGAPERGASADVVEPRAMPGGRRR